MNYLTPEEQLTVKTSSFYVLSHIDSVVNLIYSKIFEIDSVLRGLFANDMSEQKRKFRIVISIAIEFVDKPKQLQDLIIDLGRRHAFYGTLSGDLDTFGVAFMFAIKNSLGQAFTSEVEDAWGKFFQYITTTIQRQLHH